jgi:hypothetical protein
VTADAHQVFCWTGGGLIGLLVFIAAIVSP